MNQVQLLYVTVPSRDLATSIGRALIEDHLAACINILGEIDSIYRWEGALTESKEVALIVKTTAANAEAAIARIKALHPAQCPAILALPVSGGFAPFLSWIDSETSA
ncbi:MAG: divalent-cation tolerance protein CutA [Alphaproteobacteria bacterium]|nr:divalent-cation tolerance protein CutA [Alphaproteobacteria bacterium]